MLIKDLQKMGFPKNLAIVYLALFEIGEGKAGEIIRKTGFHRNIVYGCLEKLEEKTLITKTESRGVAVYKALHPDRILNELKDRENLAKNIVDELSTIRKPATQEIIVHEGKEEVQKQELESYKKMKSGETIRYLGLSPHFSNIMGEKIIDELIGIQNEKRFFIKGIAGYKENFEENYVERTRGLTDFKVVPDITSRDTEMQIFDDRVVMKTFVEPYSVIEIINPAIAKSYQDYFDVLWKQEVKIYHGWREIETLFTEELLQNIGEGDYEYVFGAGYGEEETQREVTELFLKHNKLTLDSHIEKRIIFYEQHRDRFDKETRALNPEFYDTYMKVKYLPQEYDFPLETHIFKDRATVSYFGKNPVSTLYQNKNIVAGFKNQFDFLWGIAKE